MKEELKKKFGKSKNKNFEVIDTIGVPHPYCITPKHVKVASDEFFGILGKEAIKKAEEKGVYCDICKKAVREGKQAEVLKYNEHKQALVIKCHIEAKENKELHEYLLKIKSKAEKEGFEGFVFIKDF